MSIILALALAGVTGCGGQPEGAGDSGGGGQGEQLEVGEGAGGEANERAEGESGEHAEGAESGEHGEGGGEGEHAEGDEHGEGGEEGEESGEYVDRGEEWDATRRGIRLRLAFDAERDAFVGTVENTTDGTVCAVRVEVHLAGGPELGPTERRDLGPGESADVELPAQGEDFDSWTAHPETSACDAV